MGKTMENRFSQSSKRAWKNPWVIGWLVLLGIVLVINAGMITLAFVTGPGLVDKNYYELGRDFERNRLKRIAARNALGWTAHLDMPDENRQGVGAMYRFSAVDRVGVPVDDLEVQIRTYRPSDAEADFSVPMQRYAPGMYQAELVFPLKGHWEITLAAKRGEENYDLIKRRIFVLGN
ncbi:MAG TPA: nitrogen fixation protein FixH [Gammaproteobacteria bacterium]|nr:nitrogen fixation protein FixH [Gammaproteobacteria bacterium]